MDHDGYYIISMKRFSEKEIQEILKLFEHELNLLIRMGNAQKMEVRKRIADVLRPLLATGIQKPKIFMSIVEDKLHGVLEFFLDGYEFRKKLARKIEEKMKDTR